MNNVPTTPCEREISDFFFIETRPKAVHKLTYAHNSEHDKWHQLKENPWFVIFHKEQDSVLVTERIDWTQNESGNQCTEEWTPQCFQWEVVRYFF